MNQCKNTQALRKRGARLAKELFQTILAGSREFPFTIFGHFANDAKISFSLCVMEHVQAPTRSLERASCRTIITLTVLKSEFVLL